MAKARRRNRRRLQSWAGAHKLKRRRVGKRWKYLHYPGYRPEHVSSWNSDTQRIFARLSCDFSHFAIGIDRARRYLDETAGAVTDASEGIEQATHRFSWADNQTNCIGISERREQAWRRIMDMWRGIAESHQERTEQEACRPRNPAYYIIRQTPEDIQRLIEDRRDRDYSDDPMVSHLDLIEAVNAIRDQFQEATNRIQNAFSTTTNTESADIMREVEAQETLEEKGILPPLEESMQRWQELIDEYHNTEGDVP